MGAWTVMNLAMLLAVLTVAIAVAVMGLLVGMTAMGQNSRARGWMMASLGLSIGVAACAIWHDAAAGRLIALVLVLQGWMIFEQTLRASPADSKLTTDLTTERLP